MAKKIELSGAIWSWMAEDFKRDLKTAKGEDIEVMINSPGGSVFSGLEIFNLLLNYDGKVTTHIMGLAASMASVIALAGDDVIAEENSIYMIHNARSVVYGDQIQMRKIATILESMSNMFAKTYSEKTGKKISEIAEKMNDESYFFGNEMKDYGFVDKIIKSVKKKKKSDVKAQAVIEIEKFISELQENEISMEDIEKIAASIEPISVKSVSTPENKGNIKPKEKPMSLEKLMAEDPGIKAEVEALVQKNYDQGKKDGKLEVEARITAASPFIGKTEYPEAITNLAVKVVTGKENPTALKGAVVAFDAMKEQTASEEAKKENPEETPAGDDSVVSEDGSVKNEADYQAQLKKAKGGA